MAYLSNPLLEMGLQKITTNKLKSGDNSLNVTSDGINVKGDIIADGKIEINDVTLKGFDNKSLISILNIILSQLNITVRLQKPLGLDDLKDLKGSQIGDAHQIIDGGLFTYTNFNGITKTIAIKPNDYVVFTVNGDWDFWYAKDFILSVQKLASDDGTKIIEMQNDSGTYVNCNVKIDGDLQVLGNVEFATQKTIDLIISADDGSRTRFGLVGFKKEN